MTIDLQKSLNGLLVLLTIFLGLLVGRFAATWLGTALAPERSVDVAVATDAVSIKKHRIEDFSSITRRNLFDSAARPATLEEQTESAASPQPVQEAPAPRSDLKLLGTVAGAQGQLAVIASGRNAEVYRVGDALPGNLKLVRVERDKAVAEAEGGQETILELVIEPSQKQTAVRRPARERSAVQTTKIVELEENRWQIPREEADKARSNLNALLKTARMVPKIENGETQGFTIVNIQPGTFLDLLGLKVGDVLVQINDVELNSPEKALQIFQQVREANNITLGLLRNGSRETFEYTID